MAEDNVSDQITANQSGDDTFGGTPTNDWTDHLTIICAFASFVLNTIVTVCFASTRELRTPFSMYFMALTLFNAIYNIFIFIASFCYWSSSQCLHMTAASCTVQIYSAWTLAGIPINLHVLITINRIWAMFFPMSYRNRHSHIVPIALVTCVVLYVHSVALPGVILDALYYREQQYGCRLNRPAQVAWVKATMIIVYDLPVLIMLVAYPMLLTKHIYLRRSIAAKSSNSKQKHKGFIVLSALTAGVFVCWMPYNLLDTIDLFVKIDNDTYLVVSNVIFVLYVLQTVLDPILIIATMDDLRQVLKKWQMRIVKRSVEPSKKQISETS